jgi:hypothetical protein
MNETGGLSVLPPISPKPLFDEQVATRQTHYP